MEPHQSRGLFIGGWAIASAIGLVVGGVISFAAFFFLTTAGANPLLLIGLGQALVLYFTTRTTKGMRVTGFCVEWLALTTIGFFVGGATGLLEVESIRAGAIIGFAVGVAQWGVLVRRVGWRSLVWIGVTLLSGILAFSPADSFHPIIGFPGNGLIAGTVAIVPWAITMVWLLPTSQQRPSRGGRRPLDSPP